MNVDYNKLSLVEIDKRINSKKPDLILTGKDLTLQGIISSGDPSTKIKITTNNKIVNRINKSYSIMMENVREGVPVYGTNSSFGAQAGRVLNRGDQIKRVHDARNISESLIFLDVTVGPEIPLEIVRAAMTIRINMLMQGVSGIRLKTLKYLQQLLNKNLTPVVNSFGGIGASGDLAHNQRVVSVLRGVKGAKVVNENGRVEEAKTALERNKISLLELDPKEGLALVNGDNFSTAFAAFIARELTEYYLISEVLGAMVIEVLKGTDRSFHPLLGHVRPHPGQIEVANNYRYLLKGSKLAYQELKGHQVRNNGVKVQDGYSLRCLPQFEGVMVEKLKDVFNTITINANSVSDNPLWVPEEYSTPGEGAWKWVSGGNFLAMHMAETMDTMRKITTQLVKRNDRHLARMIDTTENNGLPPNLSSAKSTSQCTFKGAQIQSGMLEVYSMLLANPVTTLFGIHEERNQDVTSHAITSGIMALKNIEILRYSIATNLVAVAQGVDLRGGPELLSPRTRPMYEFIRRYTETVEEDRPLNGDIETISRLLATGAVSNLVRQQIFK